MTPQKKSRLIFLLPALIFIINELIRTFLRPIYGQRRFGLLSDILGWLPNFLAPLGFMSIAMVITILAQNLSNKTVSKKLKLLLLLTFIIVGLTGFLLHETMQKGTGLTFDIADIYATIAGVLLGALLFYLVLLKREQ